LQQLRPRQHQSAHARHPAHNQRHIAGHADGHHQPHVAALHTLAQHKGVLRPNGDDQTRTGDKASSGRGKQHSGIQQFKKARMVQRPSDEVKLKILHTIQKI